MCCTTPPRVQMRKRASTLSTSSISTTSSKSTSSHSRCSVANSQIVNTEKKFPVVSFHKRVKVLKIRKLCDYPIEEIQNTWYQESEYQAIHKDCEATIRSMISNGRVPLLPDQCTRGLECRTPACARDRFQKRQRLVDLILDEQDFLFELVQNGEDYCEYENRLAQVVMKMTIIDQGAARRRGKRDEKEVSVLTTGSGNGPVLHHTVDNTTASSRGNLPITRIAHTNRVNRRHQHPNSLFSELLGATVSKGVSMAP